MDIPALDQYVSFENAAHSLSPRILQRIKQSDLSSRAKNLGKALFSEYKTPYGYESDIIEVDNDKFKAIAPLFTNIDWNDARHFELLAFLYGETYAPYMVKAWVEFPHLMYQRGYNRRSFRAPHSKNIILANQLSFLMSAAGHWNSNDYEDRRRFLLPPAEAMRYGNNLHNKDFVLPVAKMIDDGHTDLLQLAENIIYGKDEVGKVSDFLIRVLLASQKPECWQLVGQLLTSAQRQEGLRQTIMESVDEYSCKEAFRYIIDLVVREKLTRFSSVVRAVDVWMGMGFEADKESTVRRILTMVSEWLADEQAAHNLLQNMGEQSDNLELYTALWVIGMSDVERTLPHLERLLELKSKEKQCLALYFAEKTDLNFIIKKVCEKAIGHASIETLSFLTDMWQSVLDTQTPAERTSEELFEKMLGIADAIDVKRKDFEGLVFHWTNSCFKKEDVLYLAYLHTGDNETLLLKILDRFDEFSSDLRWQIVRNLYGDWSAYSFGAANYQSSQDKKPAIKSLQRSFAFRLLTDRGASQQATGFKVLQNCTLTDEEVFSMESLYTRKGQDFRRELSKLMLQQDDKRLKTVIEHLLESGNVDQRAGGLDLLAALHNVKRMTGFMEQKVAEYRARPKLSKNETVLLDRISTVEGTTAEVLSAENGYGVYTPKNTTPWSLPTIDEAGIYAQRTTSGKNTGLIGKMKTVLGIHSPNYGLSKSIEDIKKEIDRLVILYNENKNYEYECEEYDGRKTMVLLGNTFGYKVRQHKQLTPQERFEAFPLYEVWEEWYQSTGLDACDLFILTLLDEIDHKAFKKYLQQYVLPNDELYPKMGSYRWNNPIRIIMEALADYHVFEDKTNFLIDLSCDIYRNLPQDIIYYKDNERYSYDGVQRTSGWQDNVLMTTFIKRIDEEKITEEQAWKLWNIYRFIQFTGHEDVAKHHFPPLEIAAICYQAGRITQDEMTEVLLVVDNLRDATNRKRYEHYYRNWVFERFSFIRDFIHTLQESFLPIEMQRGDLNTPVTRFVSAFQSIYGAKYVVQMLVALGKKSFYKGYFWYGANEEMSKQKLFSHLIKNSYPAEDDTQEVFDNLVKQHKKELTEQRLIELAVYAPQWQSFVSAYLGWKGLDSGIWWMHAHTKTAEYQARSAEFESEVARYSSLDLEDFKVGAVDKVWFDEAFKTLGAKKWEMLYDAAKYIAEGNGHRRAKIYSDTLTGVYSLQEVLEKVREKRDQEFLRVYGLVPLNKKNPKKDLLERYEELVRFRKESRQFGQMRQASEGTACDVAMDNLARNAGYADPQRLTWAMETEQVKAIFAQATQVEIGEVSLKLYVEESGKAEISIEKGGKTLKAVPANLKKNEHVLELTAHRKVLREQLSRSRKGLEAAMMRGDRFTFEELKTLFEHPVISKLLQKLVFVSDTGANGFYAENGLQDANGQHTPLNSDDNIRIAHCYDLHQAGVWADYQRLSFDRELVQPFKQIFRELYVPTADELQEAAVSRRYAGHQVQPKQTLALLKGRGWKVDYEEGLQKVYHKQGFQVKLYAMADWFSPSDVEAPTFETIEFHSLKDFTNIPFTDIDPLIFSEVMRDIDLVVSVAYVGGVDPEASQSTVEMRAAILTQTLRLFKLANVEISRHHAHIKGTMGEYSVHLGSGVVHQVAQGHLSIIPVHSQHRGRLFLPFVDDDPKTAEIMSKVLLLAKDKDIKDPTVLQQIRPTL